MHGLSCAPRGATAGRRLSATALAGLALLSVSVGAGSAAADSCPNAAVRAQQSASSLPGCRAYEIVNPPTDDVGEVNRAPAVSDDGSHVAYMSVIPGDSSLGGAVSSTAVAIRSTSGWTSTDANMSSLGNVYNNTEVSTPMAFSPDFGTALLFSNVPGDARDTNNVPDGYRLQVGTGRSTWLNPWADTTPERLFGANSDFSLLLLRLADGSARGLYRTDGTTGELVSVDEHGNPIQAATSDVFPAGGRYQRGYLTGDQRNQDPWVEHGGSHGVSDDAKVVYFVDAGIGGGGRLYVRDLRSNPAVTYLISQSRHTGDLDTVYPGQFISATHDGSVAYFASPAQLTDTATPGGGIYRFTLDDQSLTQVTPNPGDPGGLNLAGAIASDDQSHIYFTSTTALAGAAVAGNENAYVWTQAGGVRFIGAVNSGDKFVRVSRDGLYAVMVSTASIGGATNNGHSAVYQYDDVAHRITCASCRPDGTPSEGDSVLEAQPAGFPGGGITHPRSITDTGQVAFVSKDRLVPQDQSGAGDVYLYDKGTVSLLTAGQGDEDSFVADNSDDGKNIFVVTRSALVGADRDPAEFDVYDVRVDGGFLEPPAPSDPCREDDCMGPPSPRIDVPSPPSARVDGPGNVPPEKIAKSFSVTRLSAKQRASFARTGKVTLKVKVTGGGTVTVRGRGSIGGKIKTLGTKRVIVLKERQTTVSVPFTLSQSARKELSKRHRLSVTLDVALTGVSKHVKTTANLTRAAHR